MHKLVDLFQRKVLRRYDWNLSAPPYGKSMKIRVDAMPVDNFNYQREAAAARLRTMDGVEPA